MDADLRPFPTGYSWTPLKIRNFAVKNYRPGGAKEDGQKQ